MTLGEKIRTLRQDMGIKQSELADKLGVSTSAVGNWELNLNKPNIDLVANMCYIFSVSPDFFFEIEKAPKPEEDSDLEARSRKLYQALVGSGFLQSGKDITAAQLEALDGISAILSALFN